MKRLLPLCTLALITASCLDGNAPARRPSTRKNDGATNQAAPPDVIRTDLTAPVVTLDGVPNSSSSSASLRFTATDAESGISHFLCQFDSEPFQACSSPLSRASLSSGTHRFSVKAVDRAGNMSEVTATRWVVDAYAPVIVVKGLPASPLVVSGGLTLNFSVSDDLTGVSRIECSLDGGTPAECSSPHALALLSDGPHVITLSAIDAVSNRRDRQIRVVSDRTPPGSLTFKSVPALSTRSSSARFEFAASDGSGSGVAYYKVRLDGGPDSVLPVNFADFTDLAPGAHRFEFSAVDLAGNSSRVLSYDWKIEPPAANDYRPVGRVERADLLLVEGWVRDPDSNGQVPVRIHVDGARLGETVANIVRQDLPPGAYGFRFEMPPIALKAHEIEALAQDMDSAGSPGAAQSILAPGAQLADPYKHLAHFGAYHVSAEHLGELKGSYNLVSWPYDHTVDSRSWVEVLDRNRLKVHLSMSLPTEEVFFNIGGARDRYLARMREDLRSSGLIWRTAFISPFEEWYTNFYNGQFNELNRQGEAGWNWERLRGKESGEGREILRAALGSFLADIKKAFPNIPTALVENFWEPARYPIPENLDVLALDAYLTRSEPVCDDSQRRKFDEQVVAAYDQARASYPGMPVLMVPGSFYQSRAYNHLAPCQADWYHDLAAARPEIVGMSWYIYSSMMSLVGIRDNDEMRNHLQTMGSSILGR